MEEETPRTAIEEVTERLEEGSVKKSPSIFRRITCKLDDGARLIRV